MTHPLDEMTPVLLKVPVGSPDCQPKLGFANDVNQRIVGTIEALSLVITFNATNRKYSIWQIGKAIKEDYAHLYSIGEDGRITVAPRALTDDPGTVISTCNTDAVLTPSTVPLKSDQLPFYTPVGNTVGESFSATPSGCRPSFASPAPYLSPFRASLQRLKAAAEPIGKSEGSSEPTQNSFMKSMHEAVANSSNFTFRQPSSPNVDLDEHIRRLSAVSILPPQPSVKNQATFNDDAQFNSFACSISTDLSQQSFTASRRRLSRPFITKPRSRQNSRTFGYSNIPGIFATASHPPTDVHPQGGTMDGLAETMDEPLLPKACLCLLWSESCEDMPQGLFVTDWTSNTPKRFDSAGSFMGKFFLNAPCSLQSAVPFETSLVRSR
ncbi:unnamed protein product [Schistocephalus solidus]|uniref:Peptidase A1 domain-containing protein n=1 Tax=Schistocephalus solidus TaxID=70667 RepID=A0A183T9J9_SCHSO|nr:unnamed protein product [Schistocephalus solidus]